MSQTGQVSSSTSQAASSISNIQLITNAALADYARRTGIDLFKSKDTAAASLKQANSREAILQLFQERAKAFKDYRDGNRRLMVCLSTVVNVIQTLSGILGERVSLVSHKDTLITLLNRLRQVSLAKALIVGIDVLLVVRPSNAPFIRFLCDV
jgi:hypothetical protein